MQIEVHFIATKSARKAYAYFRDVGYIIQVGVNPCTWASLRNFAGTKVTSSGLRTGLRNVARILIRALTGIIGSPVLIPCFVSFCIPDVPRMLCVLVTQLIQCHYVCDVFAIIIDAYAGRFILGTTALFSNSLPAV
jgi:hypothetical protein